MKTTTHPFAFDVSGTFPNARQICGWAGGCAYLAERDGISYVIIDEGTLADFLGEGDRKLLDQLVKVIAFDSEAERSAYVRTNWPNAALDDGVRFSPWVGDQYQSGFSGVRLLILGESHYYKGPHPGPEFTRELTQGYIDGTVNHRFWTLVARSVGGQSMSREQCQAFWRQVAFYNYIQDVVGVGARVAPTAQMWASARRPFREVLRVIDPDAVLVLGRRLWGHLPKATGTPAPIGGGAIAIYINHPASIGFLPSRWTPAVAGLLDRARHRAR